MMQSWGCCLLYFCSTSFSFTPSAWNGRWQAHTRTLTHWFIVHSKTHQMSDFAVTSVSDSTLKYFYTSIHLFLFTLSFLSSPPLPAPLKFTLFPSLWNRGWWPVVLLAKQTSMERAVLPLLPPWLQHTTWVGVFKIPPQAKRSALHLHFFIYDRQREEGRSRHYFSTSGAGPGLKACRW